MKKAVCALILIICAVFVFGCAAKQEEPFVVKIGSAGVYEPEFRFYFLLSQITFEREGGADIWLTTINGVKAEEAAKERAFESITRIKISNAQAERLAIELNDEDKQAAADMAEYYVQEALGEKLNEINLPPEQLQEIIEETIIYTEVFDEVTKNVEVSEKDFNAYMESYIADPANGVSDDETAALYLESSLREEYTQKVKGELFDEQYSKWEAATVIEKNNELWDSIHILKL